MMKIEIKTLQYLLDIDPYINNQDLKNAIIYTSKELAGEIEQIKKHCKDYLEVDIQIKTNPENKFQKKDAFSFFVKGNLPYYGHKIYKANYAEMPFNKDFNYIYVEDINDIKNLDKLEEIAKSENLKIFTTSSFKRLSKYVFVYKSSLNILQKIFLIKNASLYFGYDYSLLAPIARKMLGDKSVIMKSGFLSDEMLQFKFINEDSIDFIQI